MVKRQPFDKTSVDTAVVNHIHYRLITRLNHVSMQSKLFTYTMNIGKNK